MVKKTSATTTKKSQKQTNFEPTKMGLAVAAAAAVCLVVVGLLATL